MAMDDLHLVEEVGLAMLAAEHLGHNVLGIGKVGVEVLAAVDGALWRQDPIDHTP